MSKKNIRLPAILGVLFCAPLLFGTPSQNSAPSAQGDGAPEQEIMALIIDLVHQITNEAHHVITESQEIVATEHALVAAEREQMNQERLLLIARVKRALKRSCLAAAIIGACAVSFWKVDRQLAFNDGYKKGAQAAAKEFNPQAIVVVEGDSITRTFIHSLFAGCLGSIPGLLGYWAIWLFKL